MDFARNFVSSILDNNNGNDNDNDNNNDPTRSTTAYSSSYQMNNNINNTGTTRTSFVTGTSNSGNSNNNSGRRLNGGGGIGSRRNRFLGGSSNRNNNHTTNNNNNNNNSDNNNESNNGINMATEAAQFIATNLSSLFGGNTTTDTATSSNSTTRTPQQQQQPVPVTTTTPDKIPPISIRVLNKLPILTITKDDLIDPNNRQCSICFDEIQLHQKVIRLIPYCGHTFCSSDCIKPWLQKQSTCPVCRYELPTDSGYQYEQQRQIRMSYRKPRLSKYDLQYRLTIAELKQLLSLHELRTKLSLSTSSSSSSVPARKNNNFNTSTNNNKLHFTEKQDIIKYILDNDDTYVDWITLPDPVQYTIQQLNNMSISQLKYVMNNDGGVFFENQLDIVEKTDMIQYFIVSKRLIIIPETNDNNDIDNNDNNYEQEQLKDTDINNVINQCTVSNTQQQLSSNVDNVSSLGRITVETVYNDDDDNDNNESSNTCYKHTTVPVQDERIDPDMLMEENFSFVQN